MSRRTRRRLGVVACAGAILLATVQTAAAGTSATSPVELTVQGGVLEIVAPSSAVSLGSLESSADGETVSGVLGQVQVVDRRSAAEGSGWVASVIATPLTPLSGPPIPATAMSYSAGPIDAVGTATVTATDPTDLSELTPVVTATEVTGDNTATWTPTITVAVPGGAVAGTYSATITHSVL